MPDSELNFMIKLRHITTYLESGVTAARVEICKFLTFLTRSFFKLKTPTQSFRLKTTTSYLFFTLYQEPDFFCIIFEALLVMSPNFVTFPVFLLVNW